jgi:hypothetical protein
MNQTLEQRLRTDLRVAADAMVGHLAEFDQSKFDQLIRPVGHTAGPRRQTGVHRRLVILAVTSIALVVAAVAVLATRQATPVDEPAASGPTATAVAPGAPEPLLMLPADLSTEVTGGTILSGQVSAAGLIAQVGVREGDGYRDLFEVSVFPEPIDISAEVVPAGSSWTRVDLESGPADVLAVDGLTTVIQQRGTWWLRIGTGTNEAIRAIEAAVVAPDGTLSFDDDGLAILTTQTSTPTALVTASFQTSTGIEVGTATATSPFMLANTASRAEPITIRGRSGWLLTHADPDGTTRIELSWMETTDRRVMVSGDATADELREVAEGLTAVDYPIWTQRTQS